MKNIKLMLIAIIICGQAIATERPFQEKPESNIPAKENNYENKEEVQEEFTYNLLESDYIYQNDYTINYEKNKISEIHLNHSILEDKTFLHNPKTNKYQNNSISLTNIRGIYVTDAENNRIYLDKKAKIIVHYNNTNTMALILYINNKEPEYKNGNNYFDQKISKEQQRLEDLKKNNAGRLINEQQREIQKIKSNKQEMNNRMHLEYEFELISNTPEQITTIKIASTGEVKPKIFYPKNLNDFSNLKSLNISLSQQDVIKFIKTVELNQDIKNITIHSVGKKRTREATKQTVELDMSGWKNLKRINIDHETIKAIYPNHPISFSSIREDSYQSIINNDNIILDEVIFEDIPIDKVKNIIDKHKELTSIHIHIIDYGKDNATNNISLDLTHHNNLEDFSLINYNLEKNKLIDIELRLNTKVQTKMQQNNLLDFRNEEQSLRYYLYLFSLSKEFRIKITDQNKAEGRISTNNKYIRVNKNNYQ